jgi:hypothetical protein
VNAVCPRGHPSQTTDYCDQCGAPIAAASAPPAVEEADTSPAALQLPCPACGAPRSGDDRYCEGCGHDFLAPPGWEAIVTADREQFKRFATSALSFPSGHIERRISLGSEHVRIGRSRGRPGEPVPEIDLADDPGVSHMHAVLERRDDGTYAVRDSGSTNGTTLNDDPSPISADTGVPLSDGDRIRVGAWTTITVRTR